MKVASEDMLLYAVTDRAWLNGASLKDKVELALKGGATFVQLREKCLDEDEFLKEAIEICALCREYGVPFVINDNVDIAVKCDADGVHVGQSDMAAEKARAVLGPDKIIGVSAHTVEEAVAAEKAGADYLGAGAMFATGTKKDISILSSDELRDICSAVSIPVVAIGGINSSNMVELKGTGVDGVAVVSAIFAQDDICAAAKELKALAGEYFAK